MSEKNTMLVAALLIGAYIYSRKAMPAQYGTVKGYPGAVPTMPASAGAGWQQIGAGALVGFLNQAAKSLTGNGANSYVPSLYNGSQIATDYSQAGTVQDVATPMNWDELGASDAMMA